MKRGGSPLFSQKRVVRPNSKPDDLFYNNAPLSYKFHFNIMHAFTITFPKWSLFFKLSNEYCTQIFSSLVCLTYLLISSSLI
jgi:hypothetical protein